MTTLPECVWAAGTTLGEGPLWSSASRVLYWVDILTGRLLSYSPASGERRVVDVGEELGCVALREQGGMIAATRTGFAFLDPHSGELEQILRVEEDRPSNRFNDGKCDPQGRFWVGTMDVDAAKPTGALYRLDSDRSVSRMDDGYFCTNGPAWSPDGTVLYHTESTDRTIFAFDFDGPTGEISGKRVFLHIAQGDGHPDGMTIDTEGCVWVAHWAGSRVSRFTPDGELDQVLPLPVAHVTSCTFGGPDLRDLYITTAAQPLSAEERRANPQAGGLFVCRPGAQGLPAAIYRGL